MKNLIITLIYTIFITTLSTSKVVGQVTTQCNITDPSFHFVPEFDLCCGLSNTNMVCYDLDVPQADNPIVYAEIQFFDYPGNTTSPNSFPNSAFYTYYELAAIMTTICQDQEIDVEFVFDGNHTICASDVSDTDFGDLHICFGVGACNSLVQNSGEAIIPPIITLDECPFSPETLEADMNVLFTNPETVPDGNVNIFNGPTGDFTTEDLVDGIGETTEGYGPNANQIGIMMNAIVNSGALEYGVGCFNLNCLDLPSMALALDEDPENPGDENQQTEINDILSEEDVPDDYDSWAEFISVQASEVLDEINLYDLLNSTLGLQIPVQGDCPEGETISTPLTSPFWNGGDNNLHSPPPPDNDEYQNAGDIDLFSKTIPGLGLDGPGVTMPSPEGMEMIKEVKGGVDLYNGSQQTTIPLYTVQANDISIPISLSSSNNGVKVNDLGSEVGQNWNLNAGSMITRVVNGLPDEYSGTTTSAGPGMTYTITPRFEFPANMGLNVEFPVLSDDLDDIFCFPSPVDKLKDNIINGLGNEEPLDIFPIPVVNITPALVTTTISRQIKLAFRWTPLTPNLINFTIEIPILSVGPGTPSTPEIPTDLVVIYFEFGFNVGVVLNEQLGEVTYKEKGLGFLHMDDPVKMEEMGATAVTSNAMAMLNTQSIEQQIKTLNKVHSNRGLDDLKFFSDQVVKYDAWIETIAEEVFNTGFEYNTKKLDSEPDEFFFSAGSYSGKFSFNVDGNPILFPVIDGLQVFTSPLTDDPDPASDQKHISWFKIVTPDGMEYTFGNDGEDPLDPSDPFYAVDMTSNTNYYLPNFYTYPEIFLEPDPADTEKRKYLGKAQIDVAQMAFEPIYGPKKFYTYGNTWDRNYKISESPRYTSAWHLTKVRSLLSKEAITLEYASRNLTYYADKSFSHSFPNFRPISEMSFETIKNSELNPFHPRATKWENGRAEFVYSVTQTFIEKYYLTNIHTLRGEDVAFEYFKEKEEIFGDYVCDKIIVKRNGSTFKGWKLDYCSTVIQDLESTCNSELVNVPAVSIEGDTEFNLGETYDFKPFEFNSYFFINFRITCFTFPIRLNFPYDIYTTATNLGGMKSMSMYGSLMHVKGLAQNEIQNIDINFDPALEDNIYNAERKRTFLCAIHELDKHGTYPTTQNGAGEFTTSIKYKNNPDDLPARFSIHQDLYGYFVESKSGSPLPPVIYTNVVNGLEVNNTSLNGGKAHYAFNNKDWPNEMYKGQKEYPEPEDFEKVQTGALWYILLPSGGKITYNYELNQLPGNQKGAGIRVQNIEQDPANSPAKTTFYTYEGSTIVNSPVRYYQNRRNYYYYKDDPDHYEDIVSSSSSPMNPTFLNGNNVVGYKIVTESWAGIGKSIHYFTNPENLGEFESTGLPSTIIDDRLLTINESVEFPYAYAYEYGYTDELPPPALEYPDLYLDFPWYLGLEYKNEIFSGVEPPVLKQTTENKFSHSPPGNENGGSLFYFKSIMYQNNYHGSWEDNFYFQLLENYKPFGAVESNTLEDLITFLLDFLGAVTPIDVIHPYKKIYRNYYISNRRIATSNVVLTKSTTTDFFENGQTSSVTDYTYAEPNVLVPQTVTTSTSDGHTTSTENIFIGNSTDLIDFSSDALTFLSSNNYKAPLFSKSIVDGQLVKQDFTVLEVFTNAADVDRLVPESSWTLRNGQKKLAGRFSNYNEDGRPQTYEMAEDGASVNSGTDFFFSPITLGWNPRLQLTSRSYLGFATTYEYDNTYFVLKKVTDPNGIFTKYKYDNNWRLEQQVALNNTQTTTISYHIEPGDNRITSTLSFADNNNPDQIITQYFDGFGKSLSTKRINDGAVLSSTGYDNFFRVISQSNINSGMNTIDYEKSPIPRVQFMTDAVGNVTKSEVKKSIPYFVFTEITDPNGHVSKTHSNSLNQTKETESGEGTITKYDFDPFGRIESIENHIGETFDYFYNDQGQVLSKQIPGMDLPIFYWYDERFRLAASKDAVGSIQIFKYDNFN